MKRFIDKTFVVRVPLEVCWNYVADVEKWPSWSKHIRSIEKLSPGPLSIGTQCKISFSNGMSSTFQVLEFNPMRNWKWAGHILWLTVGTNLIFEPVDDRRTRLTWSWGCRGLGESTIGRILALIVSKQWKRSSSLLTAEMEAVRKCFMIVMRHCFVCAIQINLQHTL